MYINYHKKKTRIRYDKNNPQSVEETKRKINDYKSRFPVDDVRWKDEAVEVTLRNKLF